MLAQKGIGDLSIMLVLSIDPTFGPLNQPQGKAFCCKNYIWKILLMLSSKPVSELVSAFPHNFLCSWTGLCSRDRTPGISEIFRQRVESLSV